MSPTCSLLNDAFSVQFPCHAYASFYTRVYIYIYTYIYMYIYIYVYICRRMCIYIYAYIYIEIDIHVYIHTYICVEHTVHIKDLKNVCACIMFFVGLLANFKSQLAAPQSISACRQMSLSNATSLTCGAVEVSVFFSSLKLRPLTSNLQPEFCKSSDINAEISD